MEGNIENLNNYTEMVKKGYLKTILGLPSWRSG